MTAGNTVTFVLHQCSNTALKDSQDYSTSSKIGVDCGMRRKKRRKKTASNGYFDGDRLCGPSKSHSTV